MSKVDAGKQAVLDAIAGASKVQSVSGGSPKVIRVSVLKAALGPVVANLRACPVGEVDSVLDEFEKDLPELLKALEHRG